MPRNEDKCTSIKSTLTMFWHHHQSRPFSTCIDGSYHRPTKVKWIQGNSHYHQSRLLQSSKIHPVSQNNWWTRCSPWVPETPCALIWHSRENHIRSRPPFHLPLLQDPLCQTKGLTEPINSIPPQDGWPNEMDECLDWTVPPSMDNRKTKWLGQATTCCRIHPQLLETWRYLTLTTRTPNGV